MARAPPNFQFPLTHRATFGSPLSFSAPRSRATATYPTDALLKALILANVKTRLEYSEFLALLFRGYGLVLGDIEAAQVLDPEDFDKKAFLANSERLERRLKALGMLRRLSDACAYVENPFGRRSR